MARGASCRRRWQPGKCLLPEPLTPSHSAEGMPQLYVSSFPTHSIAFSRSAFYLGHKGQAPSPTMRFAAALVTSLFLPVLVDAEQGYPTATTSETGTCSQSSSAPTSTTPAALMSNSTNINVCGIFFVLSAFVDVLPFSGPGCPWWSIHVQSFQSHRK